jgi:hypothetical protein
MMGFQDKKKGGGSKKAGVNKPADKPKRKADQQARPKHPAQQPKQGTKASKKQKPDKK